MTDHHDVQDENLLDDQVLQDLDSDNNGQENSDDGSGNLVPAPAEIGSAPQDQVPSAHEILAQKQNQDNQEQEQSQPEENQEQPEVKADATPIGTGNGDDDELLNIKKKALANLSPLVSKLELPAEERFQTLMEILQASDDRSLVKPALEAAEAIEDESKRAQALLDVVNEVNYLTQHDSK